MTAWDLECAAPAKLNLFLHVVGRRSDGYHLLQTAFRLIDLADTLRFRLRGDGAVVRVTDLPGVAADADLAVRAARLLQQAAGVRAGVDIALEKRIPLGGGLGGGSSDAATVLLALNRLWGVNWPRARLQALALRLGADVPFFVFGRNAFAEGVGEQLAPLELPPAWYVLLTPDVAVPTAEIFAAPGLTRDTKPIKIADFSAGWGRNDLEPVVRARYPEVARALAWLEGFESEGGSARMSGSGASVFAPFATERAARQVLARAPGGLRGWVVRGLDVHPLWHLAE
ncbi:MAG: 4-(cytidine 5'-diphospho)-2-C-methyl-D-erythritol kinase [Pseudomonadota bacterium]|jgi:4-diphosphocytidyl-2-C-methyl-D-erythritol kinase